MTCFTPFRPQSEGETRGEAEAAGRRAPMTSTSRLSLSRSLWPSMLGDLSRLRLLVSRMSQSSWHGTTSGFGSW